PDDYAAAEEEAARLGEEVEPNQSVFSDLIDQLTARYPCITDPKHDPNKPGPWSDGPLRQAKYNRSLVLGLIFSRVNEVIPFVMKPATGLGLTIVDWQTGKIHRPKAPAKTAEATKKVKKVMKVAKAAKPKTTKTTKAKAATKSTKLKTTKTKAALKSKTAKSP